MIERILTSGPVVGSWLMAALLLLVAAVAMAEVSAETQKSGVATAEQPPQPCFTEKTMAVAFTGGRRADKLSVKVEGNPCSKAKLTIVLRREDNTEVYRYVGNFIEHMPFLIYEPELNQLVDYFANKVLFGAVQRFTSDLPAYTGVDTYYESTNDFVVIPVERYEQLRQRRLPLLWHVTGESSWVHVVYDPDTQLSQVILRGGVFQ